jgi:hypothetical protein
MAASLLTQALVFCSFLLPLRSASLPLQAGLDRSPEHDVLILRLAALPIASWPCFCKAMLIAPCCQRSTNYIDCCDDLLRSCRTVINVMPCVGLLLCTSFEKITSIRRRPDVRASGRTSESADRQRTANPPGGWPGGLPIGQPWRMALSGRSLVDGHPSWLWRMAMADDHGGQGGGKP